VVQDPMLYEFWDAETELIKLHGEDWKKIHGIEVTSETFCPGIEPGWLICTLCNKRLAGMCTVLNHVEGRWHRRCLAYKSHESLINMHASQPPGANVWGAYTGIAGVAAPAQPVQKKYSPPEDLPPVAQPPPPPPLQLLKGKDGPSNLNGRPPPPPPSVGLLTSQGGPAPPPPPGPPPRILSRPPPGDPPQNEDARAAPAAAAEAEAAEKASVAQEDQEEQELKAQTRQEEDGASTITQATFGTRQEEDGASIITQATFGTDQTQMHLLEAIAIQPYDATEFLEDGQQESGYLPLLPGDRLLLHGEPASGHATNQAPLYVYGSRVGDSSSQGWFPERCCRTAMASASGSAITASNGISGQFEC